MKRLSIVLCLCGVATAASLHFQESAFVAAADGVPPGLRPRLAFSSIRSTIAPARAHSRYRATAMAPNTAGGSGACPGWKPEPGIDSWRTIAPQPGLENP